MGDGSQYTGIIRQQSNRLASNVCVRDFPSGIVLKLSLELFRPGCGAAIELGRKPSFDIPDFELGSECIDFLSPTGAGRASRYWPVSEALYICDVLVFYVALCSMHRHLNWRCEDARTLRRD